jgi:alpha-D-ribose 1-methylphosphonate 5-triphosphate diphosphatase PhnM
MKKQHKLLKVYSSDTKRFDLMRARFELTKNKRMSQADAFKLMLELCERRLDALSGEWME